MAFAALGWQQRQEQIAVSGEAVLTIDPDSVTALAWTRGAEGLEGDGTGEDTPAHVSRMGGRFFAYYGWAAGASSCSMGPKYSSR